MEEIDYRRIRDAVAKVLGRAASTKDRQEKSTRDPLVSISGHHNTVSIGHLSIQGGNSPEPAQDDYPLTEV